MGPEITIESLIKQQTDVHSRVKYAISKDSQDNKFQILESILKDVSDGNAYEIPESSVPKN